MKFLVILTTILFLSFHVAATPFLNEIMYAPPDNPTNEWIELYNPTNQTISLNNCTLQDKPLAGNITNNSYLILARSPEVFSQQHPSIPFQEASFGNGLKNSGDTISLTCPNSTDSLSYDGSLGKKGKTLERNKHNEWKESLTINGTPNKKNSIHDFSYDYTVLQITEIMPDPFGNDDAFKPAGEWVEVYNSGKDPLLLHGLVLYDGNDNNELYITEVNTKNIELCSKCYTTIYRDGDSDFELSKIEDSVRLYTGYPVPENILIEEVTFSSSTEGMSFSKFSEGWFKTTPTPNQENIYTNTCDWAISIETPTDLTQPTSFEFQVKALRHTGLPETITAKGTIENFFGEVKKGYKPWTNKSITTTATKSYSPNLPEGTYQATFWLEDLPCEDSHPENNIATKIIGINPLYKEPQSTICIEKIYLGNDQKAEWGDQFQAKIHVYKGNETKQSVQAWVEKSGQKISKTTKILIEDKYKQYPLTLPFQLLPNCHQLISDGTATLVVKAFDITKEDTFQISGVDPDVCKDYLTYAKELEQAQLPTNQLLETNQTLSLVSLIEGPTNTPETVTLPTNEPQSNFTTGFITYQSSSEKAKNLIPSLFITTLALLTTTVLFRK